MKRILLCSNLRAKSTLVFIALIGLLGTSGWYMEVSASPLPPPGPTTTASITTSCSGSVFTVPVIVTGFNNVGSILLKLNFDPLLVQYQGAVLDPALAALTPVYGELAGQFSLTASSATGLTLPDNTALFTLAFQALPGSSGLTAFSWSIVPGECEYASPAPVTVYTSTFTDGSCDIFPIPVPTITGTTTIGDGIIAGQVYSTEEGMNNYNWTVSSAGSFITGPEPNEITVTWTNPVGNQSVSVAYDDPNGCAVQASTQLFVLYYPFPPAIDPTVIPQFVDPLPHFAAGLRIDAKAGGNLVIKTVPVQQIALSTGTPLTTGVIGTDPTIGLGNYAAYQISTDNGATWGIPMWPAQTIEAQQGNGLTVQYQNRLTGVTYADFNILPDQTLMADGYPLSGNIFADPYTGPVPMVVHLHGGEIPSDSDGGPLAWFMPNEVQLGPAFTHDASTLCSYPNQQEGTTLWYHPHDVGLTRINVYTGLAGFYFLRGTNEDALQLPGWSGDDKVMEVTPPGRTATFNGSNAYLPEIEIAVQDRMFNDQGGLYWPVAPTNPGTHPYWTPEFYGDVMTVNGKSWPYLSVAPRKYAFRFLDGCNARFLNMWLTTDPTLGVNSPKDGPAIVRISTEGGFLETPVVLDPALGQTLLLGPAERPTIIIDFSAYPPETVLTLMNDANSPYPNGDPVIEGLTDRIMQFVVTGEMVSATNPPAIPADKSVIPANLRPLDPMTKLTDFNLGLNITPSVTRQIILNEIMSVDGPLIVSVNNSRLESYPANGVIPDQFGDPTEIPVEGTTEMWQIINTTGDAHPMHPHLVQWQLVSRQAFDDVGYLAAYDAAWVGKGIPNYPDYGTYPGGSGSPNPYGVPNADGAIGGNPAVTPFLLGAPMPPLPEERGWKDSFKVLPGEVTTFMVRIAPTALPLTATADQLVFPFDPSTGPGYVFHCHIIDHEDMDMMRPNPINPSPVRFPNIASQYPTTFAGCTGYPATFSVTATSINPITYQWQYSIDGLTWINLLDAAPYSGVGLASMTINPLTLDLNTYQFRCLLSTVNGSATTNPVTMSVQQSPAPTLTGPLAACIGSKWNVYTTEPGMTGYTWVISPGGSIQLGGTAIDNTVTVKWNMAGPQTVTVNYTNPAGCAALVPAVVNVTVNPLPVPTISGPPVVVAGNTGTYTTEAGMSGYTWSTTGSGCTIQSGQGTNTATVLFSTQGNKTVKVAYTDLNGCAASPPTSLAVKVNKIKDLEANITEVPEPVFEVYPSPNKGQFTAVINSPVEDVYSLRVYNTIGVKLFEMQNLRVNGTLETMVDIRPVPPGLYYIVFMNNETSQVTKFFVSK